MAMILGASINYNCTSTLLGLVHAISRQVTNCKLSVLRARRGFSLRLGKAR